MKGFTGIDFDSEGRAALANDLRSRLAGEVRFDPGSRALYATDASNYRQVPIGVVIPKTVEDVIETVSLARSYGAPILARGGGTSLAGQCCNSAIVLDTSKYLNKLIEIDATKRTARVQPGIVLDDLNREAWKFGLAFGPDPSTHNHCTLGGMIGNNACGVHSVLAEFYGPGPNTDDQIEELEILTYDGLRMKVGTTSPEAYRRIINEGGRRAELYRRLGELRDNYIDEIRTGFPKMPRRISGYNLPALLPEAGFHIARALVGSESTCITILEATVTLIPNPPARALVVLGYPSVYQAGDHIPDVREHKPIGLEGMDNYLVRAIERSGLHPDTESLLPEGAGWLLVEFGGDSKGEADERARALMEKLKKSELRPSMKLFDDPREEEKIWRVRESGLGATARVPGERDTWEGWEDAAVHPEKLGQYLRRFRKLLDEFNYRCSLYGHFGQGCVHTRIDFDLVTKQGIETFRDFIYRAADLVLDFGGSFSGEHGDGQARAELLPKMFSPKLMEAFREFKTIWDPDGKMNPGKIVRPFRADENLRLGLQYNPAKLPTHFRYPDDEGSFARATLRCVGVGECRKTKEGVMCPSYQATLEEMHSTRGRARLLFEMLQADAIGKNGWRDDHVKEALDLCLACKACKSECPVKVDMATYKAEFLSHYYSGRIRPRSAYAFGLIYWWSRVGALFPSLVNFCTQRPLLRNVARHLAGMAPERSIPRFAEETFTRWFDFIWQKKDGRPEVILWPDTFNNHFNPEIPKAAVKVLSAAGWQVRIPGRSLCCGRPLYDYGMLKLAKRMLRQIIDTLRPEIAAGVPIVFLEPSCAAVIRDELIQLFPHDIDAQRLARQTFLLSEFLEKKAAEFRPPPLAQKALVQGHCHHRAIMTMNDEAALLSKMGLEYEILDSGCCGMAGSFGFEKDHYEMSIKCGDRVLLPAVRNAAKETLIIADGFSCREQIRQETGRMPLHLAQVIQMAINSEQGAWSRGQGAGSEERSEIRSRRSE
ncbi:MAG: FAD-binding and (Fe-S)-binding domain-containing protein [Candidatus Binatia bacterium]